MNYSPYPVPQRVGWGNYTRPLPQPPTLPSHELHTNRKLTDITNNIHHIQTAYDQEFVRMRKMIEKLRKYTDTLSIDKLDTKLKELKAEVKEMKDDMEKMKLAIEYAAGGPVYQEAKEHFESLANE